MSDTPQAPAGIPSLTLAVPYLNEARALPRFLASLRPLLKGAAGKVACVFLDSGSSDASRSLIEAALQSLREEEPSVRLASVVWDAERAEPPSIGRALKGLEHVSWLQEDSGGWVQVIPVDCVLDSESLSRVLETIASARGSRREWVLLEKRYDRESALLQASAWLQNRIRLRMLGRGFWTHGLALSARAWRKVPVPTHGFMEDSVWCDELTRAFGKPAVTGTLLVSARRYRPGAEGLRLLLNLGILCGYRLIRWRTRGRRPSAESLRPLQRCYEALRS